MTTPASFRIKVFTYIPAHIRANSRLVYGLPQVRMVTGPGNLPNEYFASWDECGVWSRRVNGGIRGMLQRWIDSDRV